MSEQPVDLWALSDLRTPWCLHVAATLRIAHQIAAGTGDIHQLAAAAGCDVYALHRVLTHLVGKGVFAEPSPGRFALNEAARQLLDPGMMLMLDLNGIGGRMAGAWGTLLEYVRTGESAYQSAFGLPFFEDLAAHPEVAASFDALIGPMGHSNFDADFPLAEGWEGVRHVVDVGGGTGAMLAALLRFHPALKGTLVDQPGTVARAAATFEEAGVAERATVVGQSFFDPLPGGADLYVLRGVINDWPDREAAAIMRRCAEAARPGGRVVVLKGLIEDNTPHSVEIEMVLVGGKLRTLAEFRELGRSAGLELVATGRQRSGISVVEYRTT